MGETDKCSFCVVMLAVPAAIACAEVGDLDLARHYAELAEYSARRWPGTAWAAAAEEARAHIARASGETEESVTLLSSAAAGFRAAGQPGDAARCDRAIEGLRLATTS